MNILISALVAALVTLAIEYAAKPQLEARKERILEGERMRRELNAVLNLAHSNFGMYADLVKQKSSDGPVERRELTQSHMTRLKQEFGEQGQEIVRLGRLLGEQDHLLFEVTSIAAGSFVVAAESGLAHVDEDEMDLAVGISCGLIRDRRKKNDRLRAEARQWVDERLNRIAQ